MKIDDSTLPDGVSATFTATHAVCGETVFVENGVEQPHVCRIDFDALAGRDA